MLPVIRVAPLTTDHRSRVEEIVRTTGVFSEDEIAVALEVFDAGVGCGVRGVVGEEDSTSATPYAPDPTPALPDYVVLGAFDANDQVVGYAVYGSTPCTSGTFDLYWIATDPAMHNAGVGTTLLNEVERRLEGHFARMLVVETSSRSDYAPTRGFYGRRGYTETARVREFYAPGDDRIIFTKRFRRGA